MDRMPREPRETYGHSRSAMHVYALVVALGGHKQDSEGWLWSVPRTCQNGAETRDIELLPDDERTSCDQESGSMTPSVKRPPKR